LIDYELAERLKLAMDVAATNAIGRRVALSNNYLGLDEVRKTSPSLVEDYVQMRTREPCPEYLVRQRLFAERCSFLGYSDLGG